MNRVCQDSSVKHIESDFLRRVRDGVSGHEPGLCRRGVGATSSALSFAVWPGAQRCPGVPLGCTRGTLPASQPHRYSISSLAGMPPNPTEKRLLSPDAHSSPPQLSHAWTSVENSPVPKSVLLLWHPACLFFEYLREVQDPWADETSD